MKNRLFVPSGRSSIEIVDDTLVVTEARTSLPHALLIIPGLFVTLLGGAVALQNMGFDLVADPMLYATILVVLLSVLTVSVGGQITLPQRTWRTPIGRDLRAEVVETEPRTGHLLATVRTLYVHVSGQRHRVLQASGNNEDFDIIPEVAAWLEQVAKSLPLPDGEDGEGFDGLRRELGISVKAPGENSG